MPIQPSSASTIGPASRSIGRSSSRRKFTQKLLQGRDEIRARNRNTRKFRAENYRRARNILGPALDRTDYKGGRGRFLLLARSALVRCRQGRPSQILGINRRYFGLLISGGGFFVRKIGAAAPLLE